MADKKPIITDRNKLYFVYFLIFTISILLFIAVVLIRSFWSDWSLLRNEENFYKDRAMKYSQLTPQIYNLDPVKGAVEAKVTIYEYSDFTCESCRQLQTALKSLADFYGPKIRFVYKSIPLSVNPLSRYSANAGYCAAEQNKFWEFKDLIYKETNLPGKEILLQIANQLSLDVDIFGKCLDSNKYAQQIDRNITEALQLQITSVPTVYINDLKVEGFISYETLKELIDNNLKY